MKAIDAYWISAAEHGMNASTFTARIIASTGADAAAALSGAVGALSGPLHGGAPSRVLQMLDDVERNGDPEGYVKQAARPRRPADGLRPPRVPRRGPARPRAAPHRAARSARLASRWPRRSSRPRWRSFKARKPDRVLATNVEFWSAVVLDYAEVPPELFTPMFTCARVAGWSAHILEQKREGRLIRPTAKYVGPGPRPVSAVPRHVGELRCGSFQPTDLGGRFLAHAGAACDCWSRSQGFCLLMPVSRVRDLPGPEREDRL